MALHAAINGTEQRLDEILVALHRNNRQLDEMLAELRAILARLKAEPVPVRAESVSSSGPIHVELSEPTMEALPARRRRKGGQP